MADPLILDPEEARKRKKRREYRLNAIRIPALRFFAFLLIVLLIPLHNRYILGKFLPDG
jgi:hypothetical protein